MKTYKTNTSSESKEFLEELVISSSETNAELLKLLPSTGNEKLFEAINYVIFSGGKRFRAFLTLQSAKLFDVPKEQALQAAAAVELIHAYSLVHDDLPSMDNDDMRRGKPTVHIKWNEATAILVGDCLQAYAYEVLCSEKTHPNPKIRINLIKSLTRAAGFHGMVLGQAKDLDAEKNSGTSSLKDILELQRLKTGALFKWSVEAASILGGASSKELCNYANAIGLAFQIKDDLLDYEGVEEETGKRVGKDDLAGKATLVSLLGVDEAKKRTFQLCEEACEALNCFGPKSYMLKAAARFTIERGF